MPAALKRITHPLLYASVRAIAGASNILSIDDTLLVIDRIGDSWARSKLNRDRLARAHDNIRWSFPDWTEQRVAECALSGYRHLFRLAIEIARAPRLLTQDGWPVRIQIGDMRDSLELIISRQPKLLITGHCGNWELLGATVGMLGLRTHALYRPLDVTPVDKWVRQSRARFGLSLIDKFGATETLPRCIERGESVGFIADQNAGDRGLFVPFFNRLASAYKTIGLLAMRYEMPIICSHAVRRGGSRTARLAYQINVVDVIRPEHWRDQPDPLFYITARYRRAIEMMVRHSPEQYLWMHRYWKSRPRHERQGDPFPDALREKIRSLPWISDEMLERIVERSARDAREYLPGSPKR